MKKFLIFLIAICTLFVLCACSTSTTESAATPTPIIIYVTPTPAAQITTVTPAPTVAPTSAPATPQPTIQVVTVAPQITKNPTQESVTEGGNATFIAKADYYNYMSWRLISPDGYTSYSMSEAPWYFQGLSTYGDGSSQLILSNCPTSLNGWYVQATFTGSGGQTSSSKAAIYVSKAAKTQLWAYPSSGYFEYCDQAIQLNAGSGDQIYYELRYNGNCYTGTVYSGGCCYIGAISDLRYDVYLYAYVVGDPTNAISCQYTMDCLPSWDSTSTLTQSMIDAINNGTYDENTNYLDDLVIPEDFN